MKRIRCLLVGLLLVGALGKAVAVAEEITVTNPNGTARAGCVEAALADIGLSGTQVGKVVDKDTGQELPFQVVDGRLAVVAELPPYASHVLDAQPASDGPRGGLTITDEKDTLTVRTSLYTLTLDKAKGYTVSRIRDKAASRPSSSSRTWSADGASGTKGAS